MEGTSARKLSLFVAIILFALASCFSTTEARRKHVHHRHFHHPVKPYPVQSPPSPAPVTLPTQPPSPVLEGPAVLPSAPPLAPPPYEGGIDTPPNEFQGCGFPCRDSYDCYGSCPICCQNQTCCSDEPLPFPLYAPSSAPLLAPTLPANDDNAETPTSPAPFPPPSSGSDGGGDDILVEQPPPFPMPYDMGVPAVLPPPGYVYSPYQVHGCGYPCTDSND